MCGRFQFTPKEIEEIKAIIRSVEENGYHYTDGEVAPSDDTLVLTQGSGKGRIAVESMVWGFPGYKKSQLIINARAESVNRKELFAPSFRENRCVILTTGFYEWDIFREKFLFKPSKGEVLYLGGFYRRFEQVNRSIILTTKPNESVRRIHERMPVILKKDQIRSWLTDIHYANRLINQAMPELAAEKVC